MDRLLKLIENDCRLTNEQLAAMLGKETGDIAKMIKAYEKDGVIVGYKALVDWDKTDRESTTALIELKVTPQRDSGFDKVAERIYQYPEVQSLYLISGGFDLAIIIEGRTLREVALFVAEKLSTLDEVTSTATHFVLRKYKEKGVIYGKPFEDERGNEF